MAGVNRKAVVDLVEAKILKQAPPFVDPNRKCRGSRRAGIIYEHKVANYLRRHLGEDRVIHGPWISYFDKHGPGWCQPDILILPEAGSPLIIGECKLTVTKAAERKLKNIYQPLVDHLYKPEQVKLLQISKNLRRDWDDLLVDTWETLVDIESEFATWILRNP